MQSLTFEPGLNQLGTVLEIRMIDPFLSPSSAGNFGFDSDVELLMHKSF